MQTGQRRPKGMAVPFFMVRYSLPQVGQEVLLAFAATGLLPRMTLAAAVLASRCAGFTHNRCGQSIFGSVHSPATWQR